MSEKLTPENSVWGWKALIITIIIMIFFMGILYLAVTSEPDYMPNQKRKAAQQALQQQQQQAAEMPEMAGMSAEEHATMNESAASMSQHGH